MIEVKYGCRWHGWCSSSVSGPYGVGLWKNISQEWPSFSHYILYDIGDGLRVKFWQFHVREREVMSSFMVTIYGSSVRGLERIRCVENQTKIRGLWLKIIIVF